MEFLKVKNCMCSIIYLILYSIMCVLLRTNNIGAWQYWVIIACVIGINLCGYYEGKKNK